MLTGVVRQLAACQRLVIVALTLIPVVMVTAACLPAVIVLPLLSGGMQRTATLINLLKRWTEAVLAGSNTAPTRSRRTSA